MAQDPPTGTSHETSQAVEQFEAAKKEATATVTSRQAEALDVQEGEGPTRPEGHLGKNSAAWTDGPGSWDLEVRSAVAWNRQVNQPYAEHNASIVARQASQPSQEGENSWAKEILEAAKAREDAINQPKEKDDRER